MRLIFLYGHAAAGKLTVGRELSRISGLPLFHNHLVVDAVASVFPFGSESFVRLRETFWLSVFAEAAREGRSLIFTFAPEGTVAADFPQQVVDTITQAGGAITFVRLDVSPEVQEQRIAAPSRLEFGKLTELGLLRRLRPELETCLDAMPGADLRIDTDATSPHAAALIIHAAVQDC